MSTMPLILPCDGTQELPAPAEPMRTRFLTIGQHVLPVPGRVAAELARAGMIYEEQLSEGFETRLEPDGPNGDHWTSADVMRLVAILLGLGASVKL